MKTAYYDRIARQWHAATGSQGGALKKLQLNELILGKVEGIAGRRILEVGAGNGYFIPLLLRRFSGAVPSRIAITDQSKALLDLARRTFPVAEADYHVLDIRGPFPFPSASFDLILANMVFNELTAGGLKNALGECGRVLLSDGQLLGSVIHPWLVDSLEDRGLLKGRPGSVLTMPGADGLRLPVVRRTVEAYASAFTQSGFHWWCEDVWATSEVIHEKPGLRHAGKGPVALVFACDKSVRDSIMPNKLARDPIP